MATASATTANQDGTRTIPRMSASPKRRKLCPQTGARLTGSGSRSRHGYRVWYYHAMGRGAYRIPADEAHERFEGVLESIRAPYEAKALIEAIAKEDEAAAKAARARAKASVRDRLLVAREKAVALDERYLDGDFDRASYENLRTKLRADIADGEARLASIAEAERTASEQLLWAVEVMVDLPRHWRESDGEGRDFLVGSMFPGGLVPHSDGGFRTPVKSPLIDLFSPETAIYDPNCAPKRSVVYLTQLMSNPL